MREEIDSLGKVLVPADRLWGAQTERSIENFKIGTPGSMPTELIKASIDSLRGRNTHLLPDFHNGCLGDFSQYNHGKKGGKIRLRSEIDAIDKSTLLIKSVPYSIDHLSQEHMNEH